MTGNSRQVILPREMVYLVLLKAAAIRIARCDRRLSNTLAILFTRRLCRGSVYLVVQCQTEHRKYSEKAHKRGHQKRFVYRHF